MNLPGSGFGPTKYKAILGTIDYLVLVVDKIKIYWKGKVQIGDWDKKKKQAEKKY